MLVAVANPMLPQWLVVLGASLAGLAIVGHMISLADGQVPASRRRIRMASGVVLLALTVLLAHALGFIEAVPPSGGSAGDARAFVLAWAAIIGLLPVVLALAGLDVLNTVRLRRATAREMRRRLRADVLKDVEIRVTARLGRPATGAETAPGGAGDDGR